MTGSYIKIPPGPARRCARCGALGTHYLTCPGPPAASGLPGERGSDHEHTGHAGEQCITRRPAADDVSSAEAAIYRLPG